MTFRVALRMRVRPGSAEAFERDWATGASVVALHPDNHGQTLARSATETDVYHVTSDWSSEEAFRAYETSDAHADHLRRLRAHREEGSMATMWLVAAPAGAAR